MLSRKYYRLIARAIKDSTEMTDFNKVDKEALINYLSMDFKADNGLFNRDTFVDACND